MPSRYLNFISCFDRVYKLNDNLDDLSSGTVSKVIEMGYVFLISDDREEEFNLPRIERCLNGASHGETVQSIVNGITWTDA